MAATASKPRDVFAKALKLSERDRAALAVELLASLQPAGVPSESDPEFRTEVERRAVRVRSGESEGLDWDDVLRELAAT